jgi:hypothetical protein
VTVPTVTAAPLAVTEAVRVTAVGEATDGDEIASVVVVTGAACAAVARLQAAVSTSPGVSQREITIRLQAEKNTFHISAVLGSHFTGPGKSFPAREAHLILSTNVE